MALADDLLDQAGHLANLHASTQRDAELRRAISTAYYAIFHLLIADAVERLGPSSPTTLRPRIGRAFAHSEMKQVCRTVSAAQNSAILQELLPLGFSAQLRLIADLFVELQNGRHTADYDVTATYQAAEVLDLLLSVREAFATWAQIRLSDEANVFLAALLFGARWAK